MNELLEETRELRAELLQDGDTIKLAWSSWATVSNVRVGSYLVFFVANNVRCCTPRKVTLTQKV